MSLDALASTPQHDAQLDWSELTDVVGRTSFGIVEIAGVLDAVEANARHQLKILDTVTDTARTVNAANGRVQAALQGVLEHSDTTLETVSSSVAQMRDGAASAQELASWVRSVHAQVQVLAKALQSVQADNNKIASIASNVNILAINANIEAARAGDAGRGFAVVANAIKDLSKKTTLTASDISQNVSVLGQKIDGLRGEAETMVDTAQTLENNAAGTDQALNDIFSRVKETQKDAAQIAVEAQSVEKSNQDLLPGFEMLANAAHQTSNGVGIARNEANGRIDDCELLVQITAHLSPDSADMGVIYVAQATAQQIGQAFEDAISRNLISDIQLFSEKYSEIRNSNPPQVMAPFTNLADRLLPSIQEPLLDTDPQIVFCAAVDRNGYLPTHNVKFSRPPSKDPEWNAAHCRNRRIFDDRVGLKSGRNTRPFLLQVYRRDMGGGAFKLMKDISAPIFVNGRHWGGFRIGYAT